MLSAFRSIERQVKVLIKRLAILFLFPSKKFLPYHSKIQLLEVSPKTEGTKTKAARCLFFVMSFPFLYILNSLESSLLFTFCHACLLVIETTEVKTGMAEKFRLFGLEK